MLDNPCDCPTYRLKRTNAGSIFKCQQNLGFGTFLINFKLGGLIMIRRCCPSSPPYTLENRIAFVLILAVALINTQTSAHAQIAFSSDRGGDMNIYVMDEDGKNVVQLTDHPQVDSTPAWSPDGRLIAFSSLRDELPNTHGNSEIYIMDSDGGNPTRLTQEPNSIDTLPAWSPYGNRIAFASNRDGTGDIYVMDADGGNLGRLTHDEWNRSPYDWAPSWSPSGRLYSTLLKIACFQASGR